MFYQTLMVFKFLKISYVLLQPSLNLYQYANFHAD